MYYISFQQMMMQWQAIGVFDFILPFIIIFTLIYAVLGKLKIFENKTGAKVVIALAIAMMAIVEPTVGQFMQQLFANTGIALAILIGVAILMLLFLEESNIKWLGTAMAFFLLLWWLGRMKTFAYFFQAREFWALYGGIITFIAITIILVIIVIVSEKGQQNKTFEPKKVLKELVGAK